MRKYSDCPAVVREFLSYHENIKAQSPRTISEYHLDMRMFLRFMKLMRAGQSLNVPFETVDIRDIDLDFIAGITTSDVYEFLSWLANDRTADPDTPMSDRGISASSRARKLSALKSFYKYLTVRTKQLDENPVADLEYPKLRRSLPRYLTLEQSAALLKAENTGAPAGAMTLPDGRVVTGKTSDLLGACSALLLNALKALAGMRDGLYLISPVVLDPIQHLKVDHLGNRNPRLHTDETLIALSISAATNPMAEYAMQQLSKLRGCDVHSSVILSQVDERTFKRLGCNLTCEPRYAG